MNFFVGQRVRVKRNDNYPACGVPVGAEGRIVGDKWSDVWGAEQWIVRFQSNVGFITKYDAGDYLEPILGDDLRACDDDFKLDLDRLLERQGIAA